MSNSRWKLFKLKFLEEWSGFEGCNSVDEMVKIFDNNINEALDEVAPYNLSCFFLHFFPIYAGIGTKCVESEIYYKKYTKKSLSFSRVRLGGLEQLSFK